MYILCTKKAPYDNKEFVLNEDKLYVMEPFRQRITAGLTLMFIEKPVRAGIRLNYEKNFFRRGVENGEDRIILELITHY